MREKIIVAIHGMGDQVRCETSQLVVRQFSQYYGLSEGVPLGHLNTALVQPSQDDPTVPGAFLVTSPPYSAETPIGFAEVYWADIPRTLAKDQYTIEEAKRWAATLVERVRRLGKNKREDLQKELCKAKATAEAAAKNVAGEKAKNIDDLERRQKAIPSDADYVLAADVIDELIETIGVLGVLLYLLDKAKLFAFDLNKILVDYLGDVQVVAEFDNYRNKIVKVFHTVMATVHKLRPNADIYIVAHSEGTVVALRGILEALSQLPAERTEAGEATLLAAVKRAGQGDQKKTGDAEEKKAGDLPPSPWVKHLRGLMTIGSPLNKHMLLWPELWEKLTPPTVPLEEPIHWVNYYDLGDPVGFQLTRTRQWMEDTRWIPFFQFGEKDDVGFTRYYFAGEAHVDYWKDKDVFGHFIETVVDAWDRKTALPTEVKQPQHFQRPGNRLGAQIFSPTLPYLWAALLLFAGVYLLYSAVTGYCLPFTESAVDATRNVLGIGVLLVGVTVAVRIPRLIKNWWWRGAGVALLAASVMVFPFVLTESAKFRLGSVFLALRGWPGPAVLALCNAAARYVSPTCPMTGTTLAFLAAALFATLVVSVVSWLRPRWGAWPLILGGAAVILGIVVFRMTDTTVYPRFEKAKAALAAGGISGSRRDTAAIEAVDRFASSPGDEPAFRKAVLDTFDDLVNRRQADPQLRSEVEKKLDETDEAGEEADVSPIWPVFLAGAIFLYLWRLAAHVFDLIVVWQHYIRSSAILDRLNEIRG